jgi:hypothetical protein
VFNVSLEAASGDVGAAMVLDLLTVLDSVVCASTGEKKALTPEATGARHAPMTQFRVLHEIFIACS